MSANASHPVVQHVLDALDDEALTVRAVVEQDGEAVAVVVENDAVRRTVLVERRNGGWEIPEAIGGSSPSALDRRPQTTTPMRPFFEHHVTQSGWPQSDGSRPVVAWRSLTGFAAEDAVAVIVSTDHGRHEAPVGPDGFFVTLARAGWNADPQVQVRTKAGELMDVQL